jgi:hypothetical protein
MRAVCLFIFIVGLQFELHADVVISDFNTVNPMNYAYPSGDWNTPLNQFQFFTDGSVSGQEVLPINGGNPTASGGAGKLGLNLDLSGNIALQLTARLLPSNEANYVQALLYDADGTVMRYSFVGGFNTSTFTSVYIDFSKGVTATAGSVDGLDLSHITGYGIQGNYYDPGGLANAAFNVQLDTLSASVIPEPSSVSLAVGVIAVGLFIRRYFVM